MNATDADVDQNEWRSFLLLGAAFDTFNPEDHRVLVGYSQVCPNTVAGFVELLTEPFLSIVAQVKPFAVMSR